MSERSNLLDQINLEATGSVARLRGFVLDLAVRGRLVPQVSAEGSGSSLVAGLRGVDRKRDPANEQAPLFDLPSSWTWSTVGSVSSYVQRGKGPDYVETSTVPVVSQKCVQWEGFLIERARFIDPKSLSAYGEERLLRDGDLLWNSTGHGTVGRVAVFRSDARYPRVVADSHVTIVRPEIEPRFLWCWLASPTVQRTIDDLVSGTTKQTELSTSTVVAHPVPVPPLAEQKRIVAKVDQLMALCDDLEARQTKKRDTSTRLTKSALQALTTAEGPEEFDLAWKRVVENFDVLIDQAEKVGELRKAIVELAVRGTIEPQRSNDEPVEDLLVRIEAERRRGGGKVPSPGPVEPGDAPFAVPAGWRWVRWGQLVLAADAGWSPQCENHPRSGDHWGVVKVSAVSWDRFLPEENKALPAGMPPRPECAIRSGDFLMSRANTAELVGRSVVVGDAPNGLMMSDKIVRCTFSTLIESRFVNLYNKTSAARAHYVARASGTSDSMKNISREVIFAMPIALPPVAEQRRILAKVEQLMKVCDELEACLVRAEARASKLVEAVVQELVA
jgi:type I restriction enzyme S subunit